MNTAELAETIATAHDLPRAKVKQVLEAAFAAVGDAVARGEEVSLPGFGKFKVTARAAREGRNPATGAAIQIAASRKAAFIPAKQLKDRLNAAG